jgi:hypothetical protein
VLNRGQMLIFEQRRRGPSPVATALRRSVVGYRSQPSDRRSTAQIDSSQPAYRLTAGQPSLLLKRPPIFLVLHLDPSTI